MKIVFLIRPRPLQYYFKDFATLVKDKDLMTSLVLPRLFQHFCISLRNTVSKYETFLKSHLECSYTLALMAISCKVYLNFGTAFVHLLSLENNYHMYARIKQIMQL